MLCVLLFRYGLFTGECFYLLNRNINNKNSSYNKPFYLFNIHVLDVLVAQ